jgi:hypothetical protein
MRAGKSGCLFASAGCKVDVAGPTYPVISQNPTGWLSKVATYCIDVGVGGRYKCKRRVAARDERNGSV